LIGTLQKKKVETTEAPPKYKILLKDGVPLWCTYIGEKGRTLGKTYEIEARCYWEHPWGTHWKHWEPIGHLMGAH